MMSTQHEAPLPEDVEQGVLIAGAIPGGDPAVLHHASALAQAMGVPLLVVHVDTTIEIDLPDPDGYVRPVLEALRRGEADLEIVRREAKSVLEQTSVEWTVVQVAGDPAMALHHLAERYHASMFVVGTRRGDIGDAVREFLDGSVALRLTRHQSRPVVVIPTGVIHPWRSEGDG
ncbi:universal stress protein [Microbacterium sp. NPDC079176]|uniref:universal stress protein n=1 Tax=unclassified Microbacterium TaxID=2609290 RepID=UPI00342FCAD2